MVLDWFTCSYLCKTGYRKFAEQKNVTEIIDKGI